MIIPNAALFASLKKAKEQVSTQRDSSNALEAVTKAAQSQALWNPALKSGVVRRVTTESARVGSDYAQVLGKQTTAAFHSLLKQRNKGGGGFRHHVKAQKPTRAYDEQGTGSESEDLTAMAVLMGTKKRELEVLGRLRKHRRKNPAKTQTISPLHRDRLRKWLVEKKRQENVQLSAEEVDAELHKLIFRFRNTKLSQLDQNRFNAEVDRLERDGDDDGMQDSLLSGASFNVPPTSSD